MRRCSASPALRRGLGFWLLVLGSAAFMSLEPSLFLVTLTFLLSAVTLFWVLSLARLLLSDLLASAARYVQVSRIESGPRE